MASGSMDFSLNLLANTTGLQQGMNGAKFAVNALVAAMAAVGVGLSVQGLAQAADSYTNLSTRINIATKESGNFEQAISGVHQIALSTNSNLTTTADLFTRLNTVTKDMGMSQQQALDLTKTVTQAIQIGGGSAQAADAAVTQFIQAMQGGVLRGEEFNSIMENGYGLAEALAKGLGVTTGELRKMAEAGELSSERVVKAIGSQAASVQATYDKFPTTIGNALQRISTSWEILIGQMDQANGASATVAQWLVMLADNMSALDVVITEIGNGFVWIGDQLKLIDTSPFQSFKDALSSAYQAVKELGLGVYELGSEIFKSLYDALTNALAIFSSFTGEATKAGEQVSFLTRIGQGLSITLGFISDGIYALRIGLQLVTGFFNGAAAAANEFLASVTWGDVSDQFQANAERLRAQQKDHYEKADRMAQEFESEGLKRTQEAAMSESERNAKTLEDSKATYLQLTADAKSTEAEKIKAVQAYAEAAIAANKGVMDGTVQADLLAKGYMVTLDQSGKVAVESLAEAKKTSEETAKANELAVERAKQAETDYQNFLKSSAAERILLTKQIEEAKKSGDLNALLSAQTSLAAIDAKERELNAARIERSKEVAQGTQTSIDQARKAGVALGLDLDVAFNRVSEGFNKGQRDLDTFSGGLGQLGATGQQAADITYQAWVKWLETAKSQAEIDAAEQKLKEFGEQGKISTSQVEQGLIAIRNQAQELPDDIDPVTESFKRLGIETKENLKIAAKQAMMDFINVRDSGKATAEGVQKAYEKAAQAAALSGDAAAIATANAAGASRNLQIQVDETGVASVQSMDKLTSSVERLSRTAGGTAVQGFRAMGNAAKDAAREAKNSIDEWNDALTAKSDAQKAEREKSSSSKAMGGSFKSYSRAEVLAELKSMGYDEAQAKKLAGSIMSSARDADRATMSKNIDPFINAQFNKLLGQGLTASAGSAEVQKRLASLANGTGLATMANTAPTQKIEFTSGQKTATVSASPDNADALKSMLSELEAIKKSS